MPDPQMVDPHDVVMTGENSFIRLSDDGGKTLVDRVSHWRVLWSPAGQGHALFIESPLLGKGPRVYADNAGVARFLQRTIEILLYKEFAAESLPIVDARFERTGNSLSTVEETFNEMVKVFNPYLDRDIRFTDANTKQLLAEAGFQPLDLNVRSLKRIVDAYYDTK